MATPRKDELEDEETRLTQAHEAGQEGHILQNIAAVFELTPDAARQALEAYQTECPLCFLAIQENADRKGVPPLVFLIDLCGQAEMNADTNTHVSPLKQEKFLSGGMKPKMEIALASHVANCSDCYTRLIASGEAARAEEKVRDGFQRGVQEAVRTLRGVAAVVQVATMLKKDKD